MLTFPFSFWKSTTAEFDGDMFFVNTDSTPGGSGVTNNTSGGNRAFASLNEALTSGMVSSRHRWCQCSAPSGVTDDLSCLQAQWNNVAASATSTLLITGTNTSGRWMPSGAGVYILNGPNNSSVMYNNRPGFVTVANFQLQVNVTTSSGNHNAVGARLSTANVDNTQPGLTGKHCVFRNVHVRLNLTGTDRATAFYNSEFEGGASTGIMELQCCTAHQSPASTGLGVGFDCANSQVIHDSCLSHCGYYNFGGPAVLINCVGVGFPAAGSFLVNGEPGSHHCFSEDGSAPVLVPTGSQDFSLATAFIDPTNGDYHLAPGSPLIGVGDTTLTTDGDGQLRGTPDDGGPDDLQ